VCFIGIAEGFNLNLAEHNLKNLQPSGYVSGSAIVFSRATMQLLAETIIGDLELCPIDLPWLPEYRFDDVAVARCLAAL
jgi:hypothetical protein